MYCRKDQVNKNFARRASSIVAEGNQFTIGLRMTELISVCFSILIFDASDE